MQKLVRDLRPGDILPNQHLTVSRSVVLDTYVGVQNHICVTIISLIPPTPGGQQPMPGPLPYAQVVRWNADSKVEVEHPVALTPAQQHADELLDLVCAITAIPGPWNERKRELLDKINPPAPPTLEEALDVVRALVGPATGWSSTADEAARQLLARVPKK